MKTPLSHGLSLDCDMDFVEEVVQEAISTDTSLVKLTIKAAEELIRASFYNDSEAPRIVIWGDRFFLVGDLAAAEIAVSGLPELTDGFIERQRDLFDDALKSGDRDPTQHVKEAESLAQQMIECAARIKSAAAEMEP